MRTKLREKTKSVMGRVIFIGLCFGGIVCLVTAVGWKTKMSGRLSGKQYPGLAERLNQGDCDHNEELLDKIQYLMNGDSIVAGEDYVAAVTKDGSILIAYETGKEKEWTMPQVRAGEMVKLVEESSVLLAVDEEGTLLIPMEEQPEMIAKRLDEMAHTALDEGGTYGTGNDLPRIHSMQISKLTGVRDIAADYPNYALALLEDGSLAHVGLYDIQWGDIEKRELETWKDVKEIEVFDSGRKVFAFDQEGKIHTLNMYNQGESSDSWKEVVAVEKGYVAVYGLTADGRVLSSGNRIPVDRMRNVISISAGYDPVTGEDLVLGIRADGTVIDNQGRIRKEYQDIVALDVSQKGIIIGLKSDGTMCISDNADEQLKETVTSWKDLLVVDVSP